MFVQALMLLTLMLLLRSSIEFHRQNNVLKKLVLKQSKLAELMKESGSTLESERKEGIQQLAKQFVTDNKSQRRIFKNQIVSNDTARLESTDKENEIDKEEVELLLKQQSISFQEVLSLQKSICGGDVPGCKYPSRKRFKKSSNSTATFVENVVL